MSNITITTIIPAYNAENFILEALDSIASQTRSPEQIIVVDDGSTDETASLVRQWSNSNNIKIDLLQQENRGLPGARNTGIRASTGDWIALLDADDMWEANHLATLEEAIVSNIDLVAAFCDAIPFNQKGTKSTPLFRERALNASDTSYKDRVYILNEKLYESILPGNYINPSSLTFKKSVALDIGLFDESLKSVEDRDYLLRLSRKGKFGFIDQVTSKSRIHEDNITNPKNRVKNIVFALKVLTKMVKISDELNLSKRELRLTKLQIKHTVRQILYASSTEGLESYVKIMMNVSDIPLVFPKLNPRHFFRALYYSIFTKTTKAL